MHAHLGHHDHTAERPDQRPESYQQIAHCLRMAVPSISHEMGDGTGEVSPWRCRKVGVEKGVDVYMVPSRISELCETRFPLMVFRQALRFHRAPRTCPPAEELKTLTSTAMGI